MLFRSKRWGDKGIVDRGIVMTGGGALIRGLDILLAQETGLPLHVDEDPLTCVGLSLIALFSPVSWGFGLADSLRETVLVPLVWLQARAEEGRTSRDRLRAITAQRDSTSYLAQGIPSLLAENEHLRQLLGLTHRLPNPYVAAEVLHQAQATDGRTLLLSVGSREGVSAFDPVVAPEGLIGRASCRERVSIDV